MRKAVRAIIFKDNQLLVMKRNKFGKQYYILPGGGVMMGETCEHAIAREMNEETGLRLGAIRPVFVEQAGVPYGVQYVYLADYISGEPKLSPSSDEAAISALGNNIYEPLWLPIGELSGVSFVSERLKHAILGGVKHGFPSEVVELT